MQDNFGSARVGIGSDWESSRFRITAVYTYSTQNSSYGKNAIKMTAAISFANKSIIDSTRSLSTSDCLVLFSFFLVSPRPHTSAKAGWY